VHRSFGVVHPPAASHQHPSHCYRLSWAIAYRRSNGPLPPAIPGGRLPPRASRNRTRTFVRPL